MEQIKEPAIRINKSLVKISSSFDLIIPQEVEAKIRHLCNRVHDIEWSGILFYKVKGTPGDEDFQATCVDLFVMDIGSVGYTQFDYDKDVLSYKIDHMEDLIQPGIYEGLIHSHNNMLAFFSGTDNNTLLEEGSHNNHFLSLIVNNAGNYVARITRKIERKVEEIREVTTIDSSEFRTFEDNIVKLTNETKSTRTERENYIEISVEFSEATIIKYSVDNTFEELDARLTEIKSKGALNKVNTKESDILECQGMPKMLPYLNNPLTSPSSYPVLSQQNIDFGEEDLDEDELLEELETHYTEVEVPENIIKSLCVKVLTGTIILKTLNVPLDKWVSKLDSYYTAVIGDLTDQDNYNRLTVWISYVIDAVITYSIDEDFENQILAEFSLDDLGYEDTDVFVKIYANNMIKYLNTLPNNSLVKDCIIKELQTYLPKIKENE